MDKFDKEEWQDTETTDVTYCNGDDCHTCDPVCLKCGSLIIGRIHCGLNGNHLCSDCYESLCKEAEKHENNKVS